MEVHLQGIAMDLTEDGLKKQLDPVMAKLKIASEHYHCEKPRRQRWANVTFLNVTDGKLFLRQHGQEHLPGKAFARQSQSQFQFRFQTGVANGVMQRPGQRPQTYRRARLRVMNQDVFCKMSDGQRAKDGNAQPGEPDPITIRGLKYAAEERARPTRRVEKEAAPTLFQLDSLSCGQCSFSGDQLVYIPEVEFQDTGIAKFTKRELIINLDSKRIIKIQLNTIVELICSFSNILTITLSDEPHFFADMDDLMVQFNELSVNGNANRNEPTRIRLCSLDERHKQVVGQCLVYRLQVSAPDIQRRLHALKNNELVTYVRYNVLTLRTPPPQIGDCHGAMRALRELLTACTRDDLLPFDVLFQLQALAYNAFLHPGIVLALAKELCHVFRVDKAKGSRLISSDALKKLFNQIDWPRVYGVASQYEVSELIRLLKRNEQQFHDGSAFRDGLLTPPARLARIYRVTVTPTRITLHGPEMEAKNRILRKFPNHHDFFIRVQFCDENGQDLFFNHRISYDQVYARFKDVLNQGIQIAGRSYSFLGFSHSSLRSHSVWFSAPFLDDNGDLQAYFSIIKALGSFTHIRCPPKCAARIGQAFSETPYSLSLDEFGISVKKIADVEVKDGHNLRTFSDGVGTLSWDVIHNIWDIIPQKKSAPIAFQIRFKGAKGMLALDTRLPGSQICIRPSMTKFDSDDTSNLEICDMASRPIPLVMNRQMIKILEDMGVQDSWFMELQHLELTRLRGITANAGNVSAFVKRQNIGESIRLNRLFQDCHNLGVDYRKDDFLRSVVEAIVLRELRLLKHKARIPVKEGMTLFGIMDETKFLKEEEVYITYSSMEGRLPFPPGPGKVIVTRSPALHPGDIQYVNNVIPPTGHPLTELSNVIVFSQLGTRDLPSQLSGGDLDGDIFNVIWDERATPMRRFSPADYPATKPKDLDREVTKEDMADFFVDFMRMDHLGVIATRHMILADQSDLGTMDEGCLRLAEMHSTAVDFSKTGIRVDLKSLPRANKTRPDFLAPGPDAHIVDKSTIELDDYILEPAENDEDGFSVPRHKYYRSEKLLGQLYRAIDEKKIWHEEVQSKVRPMGTSFWDELLSALLPKYRAIVGEAAAKEWASHMDAAKDLRSAYEDAINGSRDQYSDHPTKPITELEVFIGFIFNKSGLQSHRQRDRSIKLKDESDRIAGWIMGQMRRNKYNPDVPLTGYQTEYDSLHLCLACVYTGGEKAHMQETYREGYGNMMSFRVIAACAFMAELTLFEMGHGTRSGGGYVGVGAGRSGGRAYARVPPPSGL